MPHLSARTATLSALAQVLARGISLGFVVLSSAIVARTLGVVTFADWGTVLSLVTLFGFLLDPGISPVVVRRIAQDHTSAPTPAAMARVRLALGLAAFALVAGVSVALRGPDALVLAVALALQLVPRALVLNATPWLQSDHRLHRQTMLEAVTSAVGLAGLLVVTALDAPPAYLALAGFALPTSLLAVLIRREVVRTPSASLPSPGPQRPKVRAVLAEVLPIALALALVAIYMRTFTVFVNASEDDVVVGRFVFAYQFIEQVVVIAGIVAGVLLPMIAARGTDVAIFRAAFTRTLTTGMFALGALGTAALVALGPLLCRLVGGPELAPADRWLALLAPMSTVILPGFLLAYTYLAIGEGRRYLFFNAAALAANLAANAALTLQHGADAAARVAWGTELLVVLLALAPMARARAGAATAARGLAMVAAAVAGAELAAADVVAPAVAALVPAAAAAALGGPALLRFAAAVRSAR